MKLFLIGIFTLMAQSQIVQELKLHYYCSDVKIISEYTGETINRCELFLNKEEALKKLGSDLDCELREVGSDSVEFYQVGGLVNEKNFYCDQVSYKVDSTLPQGTFGIFSKRIKLLIDNKYLVQVGDNIEEIFKEYKPIPFREDQKITQSAVYIPFNISEAFYFFLFSIN